MPAVSGMKRFSLLIFVLGVLNLVPTQTASGGVLAFNHDLYANILDEYLDQGKVNYQSLRQDPKNLNRYLRKIEALSSKSLEIMSRDEQMAFYLNLYNAFTLKAIIEHYPVKSIKNISGVWDKLEFPVAGSNLTLNQIEYQILRKQFKEPRVHFALVCASTSCPELRSQPFSGKNLDQALDEEASKFINDKTKVRLDKEKGILYVSSIFKWFREDFGDVEEFIAGYLPREDKLFILENKPKIRYLRYDWSLNDNSAI